MSFLYNFGFGQEDEITQAAAIEVKDGNVLCIASAGDLPLSFMALGARSVIAIDISESQLHLCHLKAAAIELLDREAALKFLGFMPASPVERKEWLSLILPLLPPITAEFWTIHAAAMCNRGAIWCGRYERFLTSLRIALKPLLAQAFEELIQCAKCDLQREIFENRINRTWLRVVFRFAFNPSIFSRLGMDPTSLARRKSSIPLGDQYWSILRAFCTDTPAAGNPWLQLLTLGRLISPNAAPAYLTPAGFEQAKRALGSLKWMKDDVRAFVRDQMPRDINKVCLSNLPDWLDESEFEDLIRQLACRLPRGSRLVWCYLHARRDLPPNLAHQILISEDLGIRLRKQDRFPFYRIVPAYLR
jgi:S-adenosylmethionine-diacylglycerol 3-amino-3-carboxypropyl transferase